MWILCFICFLLITFLVGYCNKEELTEVLPVTAGGLILFLYILAMCRNMLIIEGVAVAMVAIVLTAVILMGKDGRHRLVSAVATFYANPRSLVVIVGLVVVVLLTSGHIATWWDDVNYWATDAKALYFLNGFTGKYGNVAPEFGDYPPAIQIMKWCLAKIDVSTYREGFAFAGYYLMNMIFCLPVLKKTKGKNIFVQIIGVIIIFLIPGVVNDVWSHGACADITMGIIYGSVLISLFDRDNHTKGFYFARLLILLSVLPLTKSVGFEWAIYASIMILVTIRLYKDINIEQFGEKYRLYYWITIMTAVSVQLSWWINCLVNRRIAKLTSSGAHMATGGYRLPDNAAEKASLFAKGFAFYPMHTDNTVMLDLSSLTMVVIVVVAIILLKVRGKIDKKECVLFSIYTIITALIAYGIIFIGHITIFVAETQYDTPQVMAISISRYAAPFTVGMLMLLIYMLTDRFDSKWALIGTAAFVLLTTDYIAAYNCLWGYRDSVDASMAERSSMIDDNGRVYVETVNGDKRLWGHRVLYFRDAKEIHWVKDTYINHEVAPVPTVYTDIRLDSMTSEDIRSSIATHHAEYIYVDNVVLDEQEVSGADLFGELVVDESGDTVGSFFEYCKVYRIK